MTDAHDATAGRSLSHWAERLRALRNVPALLAILWESERGAVVAVVLARALAALVPVAILTVSRFIIDGVVTAAQGHPLLSSLWWLVAAEFSLFAAGALLHRAIEHGMTLLSERFMLGVTLRVVRHASTLDLASLEDPLLADTIDRARVQATDRFGMVQELGRMVEYVVVTSTLAVGLFVFAPWLLLFLIVSVVPLFIADMHFTFRTYAMRLAQTPRQRQLRYLRFLGASRRGAKEVKLFGLTPFISDRYEAVAGTLYGETRAISRRRLAVTGALAVFSIATQYGAYAYLIWEAARGRITIGTLTFLIGTIAGVRANVQSGFASLSGICDEALFAGAFVEFLALRPRMSVSAAPVPVPARIVRGLEFRDVSFTYPGAPAPVLRSLNFHWRPGEHIALVGENGEGKTTIVKLVARLYAPTEGQVLLDGVDLRDYDPDSLHRALGILFQDFVCYDMTARENIAAGAIEKQGDFEAIRGAARMSLADSIISALPAGYEQMLGREFEGGIDLSGGQWQKIALARAYLRDSAIVILDEPTAALDAYSEWRVFESFAELMKGKMALLISHRFSTVRMAHRIFVLHGGQIAEEGDHSALMAAGGRYQQMFTLQAGRYL